MLRDREQMLGLHQAHLPLAWLAGGPLDPLVHGVHDRPSEVRLWVRQLLLVVRARRLGQGEESLGLEVREENATLPGRAGLNKKLGQH